MITGFINHKTILGGKMNHCKDCYWYSDVTVKCCELCHEPANPDDDACDSFEQVDLDEVLYGTSE